ncbi:RNA-binding protein pop5 [Dimargaris cristalligena]|nr:RNA-binding protein pop5 [Dimargaris cristalligena]
MVRLKDRYILFEVVFEQTYNNNCSNLSQRVIYPDDKHPPKLVVSTTTIFSKIRDTVIDLFGDVGHSQLLNRVQPRDQYQQIWAALSFIRSLDGKGCMVRALHLSGTIVKCQRAAIRYNQELLLRWCQRNEVDVTKDAKFILSKCDEAIMAIE